MIRYVIGCDAVHPDSRGGQHVAKHCTGVLAIDDELGIGVMVNFHYEPKYKRALAVLDRLLASDSGEG